MSAILKTDNTAICETLAEAVEGIARLCLTRPFDPDLYRLIQDAAAITALWVIDSTNQALDASDSLAIAFKPSEQDKPGQRLALAAIARLNEIKGEALAVDPYNHH